MKTENRQEEKPVELPTLVCFSERDPLNLRQLLIPSVTDQNKVHASSVRSHEGSSDAEATLSFLLFSTDRAHFNESVAVGGFVNRPSTWSISKGK